MQGSNSFFNLLFEFSFSRFIGIKVVGVLYGIGMFFAGLIVMTVLGTGFSQGIGPGLISLILSPILFLVYVILLRVSLEGFVATLRTAENTTQLVENARRTI
jgi:Domain of unknown function (DUF4282)